MCTLLRQGLSGPMNWLVQPESTMDRRSSYRLRAGTKVLQENNVLKTKESLGLTVTGLCQGAGLQFLCVPPFLSWRVASFWWPVTGVGHFQLRSGCRISVVLRGAANGLDTCSAELLSEVGDGNMKICEVLQGDLELGVGVRAVCGECAVGRSESCYQGVITGRGRR